MDVVRRNETAITGGEDRVLGELHERIKIEKTKNAARVRSEKEIDTIIRFWWHLQEYRTAFLRRKRFADTAEVILNQTQTEKVKRNLEDTEFLPELTPCQQAKNRSGIYNAMLHRRCGWSTVANAIVKYQLPELPHMSAADDIRQHVEIVQKFCCDMLTWLKRFAEDALIRKESEKKAG